MKSNVVNYRRVVFQEIDTGYLVVPKCHKMYPVHTTVLNLEDPLVLNAPAIRGHKTFVNNAR